MVAASKKNGNFRKCFARDSSKIARLTREGKTVPEIARQMEVSQHIIRRVLKALGLVRAPRRRIDYRAHSRCDASEVVRLRAEDKSFAEIARDLTVSTWVVKQVFRAVAGNPAKRIRKRRVDYRAHPRCNAAEVSRLRAEGKSLDAIARQLGVSYIVVWKVFQAVRNDAARPRPRCDTSAVARLIGDGKSMAAVSRELKVTYRVVRRVVKVMGLRPVPRKRVDYRAHPMCNAAEVLRLRGQGKTLDAIAREIGVSRSLIDRVLHAINDSMGTYDARRRGKKRTDYQAYPRCNAAEALRLRQEGKSLDQIAREIGVSRWVVSRVLRAIQGTLGSGAASLTARKRIDYRAHRRCNAGEVARQNLHADSA